MIIVRSSDEEERKFENPRKVECLETSGGGDLGFVLIFKDIVLGVLHRPFPSLVLR
jgi:hypothetical protein